MPPRSLDSLAPLLEQQNASFADGEIPGADRALLDGLKAMREEHGLEIHGLLVGSRVTSAMEELCSHLHIFQSWSTVSGRDRVSAL